MVRRDDHQIPGAHESQHLRQPLIKGLQRIRESHWIIPVAVDGVRVHQVGEAQAVKIPAHETDQAVHAGGVSRCVVAFRQSPVGKDVLNLSHADTGQTGFLHRVRQGSSAGRQGEIPPVAGADKMSGGSHERPGDHPSDAQVPLQHVPGDPAELIQLLRREQLLMAGNLEHAVGAGIDDGRAVPQMGFPQLLQNHRARSRFVADAPMPDRVLKATDELLRKAFRKGRKRLLHPHAGDLPVAGGRILASALLNGPAVGAGDRTLFRISRRRNPAQPEPRQIRQLRMAGRNHMPQGIGSRVPVFRGVRRFPGSRRVQDGDKYTTHALSSVISHSRLPPRAFPPAIPQSLPPPQADDRRP